MRTFILVPGAFLGGWAWAAVAHQLEQAGHASFPVTLSGMEPDGEAPAPDVDINDYVSEVAAAVVAADANEVVLVGHSFGGAIVGAAADYVADRLVRVVYVDTGPMPGGASYTDFLAADQVEFVNELIEAGEGRQISMPSWDQFPVRLGASIEGLEERDKALMGRRGRPQPVRTWTAPLHRPATAATSAVPKTLIACSWPLEQIKVMVDAGHPWFAELSDPEWEFVELPTGHWPMFSRPQELAELLATR